MTSQKNTFHLTTHLWGGSPGPSFIKPDQLNPRIKDQLRNALLSTILSLQLPNFVSCGRACPSHMTQNLVTVGAKLWTGEWFSFDPWSLDQADLVWYKWGLITSWIQQNSSNAELRSETPWLLCDIVIFILWKNPYKHNSQAAKSNISWFMATQWHLSKVSQVPRCLELAWESILIESISHAHQISKKWDCRAKCSYRGLMKTV